MVTKKQINTNSKVVIECIEALKQAHQSPLFTGKSEQGNTIFIKFSNKVNYKFVMNDKEYLEYKELEKGLWK